MSASIHGTDTRLTGVRVHEEHHPKVRTNVGAVLVGTVVAITTGIALTMLGTAIGTSLVDATERSTPSASSMTMGAGIWLLVANLVGLFVGGTVAGRLSGSRSSHDGGLHGMGVWGLTFLFAMTVIGGLVGQIGGTLSAAVGGAAGTATSAASSAMGAAASSVNPQAITDRVRMALTAPENPAQMNAEQRAAEVARLLTNRVTQGSFAPAERTRLSQLVAAETNMTVEEAGRRIDAYEADAVRVARETEERARVAADATAKAASLSAWWFFATMLLGGLAAWIGATRGAASRWDHDGVRVTS